MPATDTAVHMFWAYGDLSKLERLCISSFVLQGYRVKLWTYDKINNAPSSVQLCDAREILDEKRVFLNRSQSIVSFSDLFRYKLLNEVGGLYADTDVIALASPDYFSKPLVVTERQTGGNDVTINNNIIYNPQPHSGNLIDLAYSVADHFPPEKITWDEIGPRLLTSMIFLQPEHGFQVMAPDFANPFEYWKCPGVLLTPSIMVPEEARFVHCYSSWWGRTGTDKNMSYPPGSLMASFEAKFGSLL